MRSKQPYIITGEDLRTLIAEKPRPSRLHIISSHPLIVVILGGFIGGLLTQYYTYRQKDVDYKRSVQQQELFRQRSFSDERNKVRIQKFSEVWERIDENELAIDTLLKDGLHESSNMTPDSKNKMVDDMRGLIHEDTVILSKNKIWIGEELYNKTRNYLDINIAYGLNKLMVGAEIDLSELIKRRETAKQDLLHARTLFLECAPSPNPQCLDSKNTEGSPD